MRPSSAIFFTAMDSPEVDGPMIATTRSSISCLAKDTAFSGLPAESLTISSTCSPLMPPSRLMRATAISALRASGPPRNEAGPVTAKIAPTLMAAAAVDHVDAASTRPAAHPRTIRRIPLFMLFPEWHEGVDQSRPPEAAGRPAVCRYLQEHRSAAR